MADLVGEDDREVWHSYQVFYYATTNSSQRLKAALWYAVGQIVDEESLRRNRNATPQFIGALTEMVWAQMGTFLTAAIFLQLDFVSDKRQRT